MAKRQAHQAKLFAILLAIVLASGICLSEETASQQASSTPGAPAIYEDWSARRGNMFNNFWGSVSTLGSQPPIDPDEDADMYGWYKGTFFGLAGWEKEVCLADLSSDVRSIRDSMSSSDGTTNVYSTTITLSSIKTRMWNGSIFEVSWYFAPYQMQSQLSAAASGEGSPPSLEFRVYLTDDKDSEFIIGSAEAFEKMSSVGTSGYEVIQSANIFSKAVFEYRLGGGESKLHQARVVERNETR